MQKVNLVVNTLKICNFFSSWDRINSLPASSWLFVSSLSPGACALEQCRQILALRVVVLRYSGAGQFSSGGRILILVQLHA